MFKNLYAISLIAGYSLCGAMLTQNNVSYQNFHIPSNIAKCVPVAAIGGIVVALFKEDTKDAYNYTKKSIEKLKSLGKDTKVYEALLEKSKKSILSKKLKGCPLLSLISEKAISIVTGYLLFSELQKEKDIRHVNDIVCDEINTILAE